MQANPWAQQPGCRHCLKQQRYFSVTRRPCNRWTMSRSAIRMSSSVHARFWPVGAAIRMPSRASATSLLPSSNAAPVYAAMSRFASERVPTRRAGAGVAIHELSRQLADTGSGRGIAVDLPAGVCQLGTQRVARHRGRTELGHAGGECGGRCSRSAATAAHSRPLAWIGGQQVHPLDPQCRASRCHARPVAPLHACWRHAEAWPCRG